MSVFGQPKPAFGTGSIFSQPQQTQQAQPQQQGSIFGQAFGAGQQQQQQQQQHNMLAGSLAAPQQQAHQMPALSQNKAELSNSLWQVGKETHRKDAQKAFVLIAR